MAHIMAMGPGGTGEPHSHVDVRAACYAMSNKPFISGEKNYQTHFLQISKGIVKAKGPSQMTWSFTGGDRRAQTESLSQNTEHLDKHFEREGWEQLSSSDFI